MRIDEIHIYGFGQLQDVSYQFQGGLNIIEGLNEAGKTTLMAFIRGVLFGFESRRNPERRYEPLAGGKFGGAIVLTDADGVTYRVERIFRQKVAGDVTVQLPDGGEAGEAFLQQLLHKMDEKVFKNIFAFGLRELSQIDMIQEDEINQFIYTAGTGDGNAVRDMQKKLTEQRQALFRPGGSKAKINAQLQQIREANQQLHELRQQNMAYEELVSQRQQLDKQIATEEALVEERQLQIDKQRKWLAHYDDYVQYLFLQDQLAALPKIEQFPADGITRLQTLQDTERDWQAQLADLKEKRQRLEEQLQRDEPDGVLLHWRTDIEQLRDQLSNYRERKEQAEHSLIKIRREQERLTGLIEQLGTSWSEQKILATDTSVAAKQAVRNVSDELRALKEAHALAERERSASKQDYEQHTFALQEWQSGEPERASKSEHELTEERRELERARELARQQESTESRIHALREQLNQYSDTYTAVSQPVGREKGIAWKWGWLVITIVLPTVLWLFNQPLAAVITGAILAMQTVREFRKPLTDDAASRMADDLARKKQAVESELTQLQTDLDEIRSGLSEICHRFGWKAFDEHAWMSRWERERDVLRKWENWQEQLRVKQWHVEQAHTVLRHSEQTWEQTRESYQQKLTAWRGWLQSQQWISDSDLDENNPDEADVLSPELVLEMMRDVEIARESIRQLAQLQVEREGHERFCSEYLHSLHRVLDGSGVHLLAAETELQVRELTDRLARVIAAEQHKQSVADQLEETKDAIRSAEYRLQEQKEAMAELFAFGGVTDAEAFRLRAEQYEQRKRLEQACEPLYRSLCRLSQEYDDAAADASLNRLLDDLSKTSKQALSDKLDALQEAQTESRTLLKQLRNERGTLSAKIDALASGTELAERQLRLQQLVSDLQHDAETWAVIALSEHLLQRALEVYEREKQPGVLRQASDYLCKMTDGRYRQVLAPLGEQTLEVVRQDGKRFEPAYLSRGTVEQLYLAMRFALVDQYTNQPLLPMVLDDIFVNFDPERTRAAIRTLMAVATRRQVLYFTCHSHICAMFEEEGVHNRIRLSRLVPVGS